jgi:Protein of unknown function (DUF2934)
MDTFEDRVRQRAYRLWVEEGCPEGRSDVHWDKAREVVAIEEDHKLTLRPAPRADQRGGEPIEAVENTAEFPTMTDQGEEQPAPKRRAAAPKRALKSETKSQAPARPKAETPARGKASRGKGR